MGQEHSWAVIAECWSWIKRAREKNFTYVATGFHTASLLSSPLYTLKRSKPADFQHAACVFAWRFFTCCRKPSASISTAAGLETFSARGEAGQ
jgi:hypothetical protein